jgi:hypothetical protein
MSGVNTSPNYAQVMGIGFATFVHLALPRLIRIGHLTIPFLSLTGTKARPRDMLPLSPILQKKVALSAVSARHGLISFPNGSSDLVNSLLSRNSYRRSLGWQSRRQVSFSLTHSLNPNQTKALTVIFVVHPRLGRIKTMIIVSGLSFFPYHECSADLNFSI